MSDERGSMKKSTMSNQIRREEEWKNGIGSRFTKTRHKKTPIAFAWGFGD
jgi:hypothetical protein